MGLSVRQAIAGPILVAQACGQLGVIPKAGVLDGMEVLESSVCVWVIGHLRQSEVRRFTPPERDPIRIVLPRAANVVEAVSSTILQLVAHHKDTHVQGLCEVSHICLVAPMSVAQLRELVQSTIAGLKECRRRLTDRVVRVQISSQGQVGLRASAVLAALTPLRSAGR